MGIWKKIKTAISSNNASKESTSGRPRRNPGEALAECEETLRQQPGSAKAWFDKGLVLLELRQREGRYEEALSCFEQAIRLGPIDVNYWRFKGHCLQHLGRIDEALSAYGEAVRLEPNDVTTRMVVGDLNTELGRHEDALRSYDGAVSVDPKDPTAWYCKACSLGRLRRWEEAIQSFGAAAKLKTDYYNAWYMKGITLDIMGKHEEAFKAFRESIRLQPMQDEGSYRGLGRDKNAQKSFDEAISLNPDLSKEWFDKGELAIRKYETELLMRAMLHAVKSKREMGAPSFDEGLAMIRLDETLFCIEKGFSLIDLNRLDEALAIFQRSPEHPGAWYGRSLVWQRLGRKDEELRSLEEATRLNPDYFHAWYQRGLCLLKAERYSEALFAFEQAVRLKPDDKDAWVFRGLALQGLQKDEEALAALDKALGLDPDDPESWYFRGLSLLKLHRDGEALVAFQEATRLRPDYPAAWSERGTLLVRLSRFEEALDSLRQAPDDAFTWYHRGWTQRLETEPFAARKLSHSRESGTLLGNQWMPEGRSDTNGQGLRHTPQGDGGGEE